MTRDSVSPRQRSRRGVKSGKRENECRRGIKRVVGVQKYRGTPPRGPTVGKAVRDGMGC